MNLKGNGNIYICAYYRRNVTDEESRRNFETSVTRASAINNEWLEVLLLQYDGFYCSGLSDGEYSPSDIFQSL
jgi:hypothetical protein